MGKRITNLIAILTVFCSVSCVFDFDADLKSADVKVEGEVIGAIDKGYMVLLGACEADTKEIADKMIKKMVNLRIFADAEGKTNLSLQDVGGSILLVSQFTLYADCKKGNRPSFVKAGDPKHANMIYEYTIDVIKNQYGIKVEKVV